MKNLKLKGIEQTTCQNYKNITPRLKVTTIEKLKKLAEVNKTSMNKILEYLINEKVK